MNARPIDERNVGWAEEATKYVVLFWQALGNLKPRALNIGVPYSSAAFELTGARDVTEALDWANANAQGRTFTLYAVDERDVESGGPRRVVQLFGVNPMVKPRLGRAEGGSREPLSGARVQR